MLDHHRELKYNIYLYLADSMFLADVDRKKIYHIRGNYQER